MDGRTANRTAAMDTFRWGSWEMSLWECKYNNTAAQKILAQKKKNQDFFQRKCDKKSLTTKIKFCPNLIIFADCSEFLFRQARSVLAHLVFFYVRSNLFASKYISRELTQMNKLWLPAR